MKKRIVWILIAILIAMITILSVLNVEEVPLNFGFRTVYWPLILIIVGSFLIGCLLVGLFGIIRDIRYRREIKELESKIRSTEEVQVQENEKIEYKYKDEIDKLNQKLNGKNQTIRELERKIANTQSNTNKDYR